MEKGVDPDWPDDPWDEEDMGKENGWRTILMHAVRRGQEAMCRLLLEHGADPNWECHREGDQGEMEGTPLQQAVWYGRLGVVEILLKHRGDPNLADRKGHTLLHEAASIWDVDMVTALLRKGADPNRRKRSGRTPIDIAARDGREDIVAVLQQWGNSS